MLALTPDHSENQLDRDTALFLVCVMAIIVMCLMGMAEAVVLATVAVLGLIYVAPATALRKMMGYQLILDLAYSYWLIATASTTLGGLTMAVAAGLLYTVVSRELRNAWGAARIAINGDSRFGAMIAHCATWTVQLGKNVISYAFGRSTSVMPAEPLNVTWVDVQPAGGFRATRTYRALSWLVGCFL